VSDPVSDPAPIPPASPAAPPPAAQPAPVTYPAPPVRPAKEQGRGGTILLAVAGLVAVAGVAFAGGRLTAPPAAAANGGTRTGNFPFGSFAPGGGFRGGGGGAFPGGGGLGLARSIDVRGQVTAVTADSITIQTDTGADVTLPIDSSTTYHSAAAATSSSVTVGSTVVIEPGTGAGAGQSFTPGTAPSLAPGATPGPFGGFNLGPATDVTVIQP